jgi:acyl carrier protein
MNTSKKLEDYVLAEIAAGLGKKTLDPDEDLLDQGVIDSLGLMKLISFMEETFSIKIPDDEIVPDNFQSINRMVKLVELQAQSK